MVRDEVIELLAQTVAPKLYQLFGQNPEDMGFPIYDTKEEVEIHLARQFDPVNYWLDQARSIAETFVSITETGGVVFGEDLNVQAMLDNAVKHRADFVDGAHVAIGDIPVPNSGTVR